MLITKGAFRGLLVSYVLLVVAFLGIWWVQHGQSSQAANNKRAISYICSTTTTLDKLVVSTVRGIKTSFADGRYQQLVKQGILTQDDLDNARKQLHQFERAHVHLTHDSACQDVLAK